MTQMTLTRHDHPRLNLLQLQAGLIAPSLSLIHPGPEPLVGATLTVTSEPPILAPWSMALPPLPPGIPVELNAATGLPPLRPNFHQAMRINEERAGTLILCVDRAGEPPLVQKIPTVLEAAGEWHGDCDPNRKTLAGLITPNTPRLTAALAASSVAFSGYQDPTPGSITKQIAATLEILDHQKIRYLTLPASFRPSGQKVRFPAKTLEEKQGACLDIAVLLASIWERIGLYPLVLFTSGHAFTAVWLRPDHQSLLAETGGILGPEAIRELVQTGDILVLDSVPTPSGRWDFRSAQSQAQQYLNQIAFGLDLRSLRRQGLLPVDDTAGKTRFDEEPHQQKNPPTPPRRSPMKRIGLTLFTLILVLAALAWVFFFRTPAPKSPPSEAPSELGAPQGYDYSRNVSLKWTLGPDVEADIGHNTLTVKVCRTADPKMAINRIHAEQLAFETAKDAAHALATETLMGVRVSSRREYQNQLLKKDSGLFIETSGHIKGGVIDNNKSKAYTTADGIPVGEVYMTYPLYEDQGRPGFLDSLSAIIQKGSLEKRVEEKYTPHTAQPTPLPKYTGILFYVRGQISSSLYFPLILCADQTILFDSAFMKKRMMVITPENRNEILRWLGPETVSIHLSHYTDQGDIVCKESFTPEQIRVIADLVRNDRIAWVVES